MNEFDDNDTLVPIEPDTNIDFSYYSSSLVILVAGIIIVAVVLYFIGNSNPTNPTSSTSTTSNDTSTTSTNSNDTSTGSTIVIVPPTVVGIISVSNLADTTLTLSWPQVAGATSYIVYQDSKLISPTITINPSGTCTCDITGLLANTTYSFTVQASNSAGIGPLSSPVVQMTTPSAVTFPTGPLDLYACQAIITWNLTPGATGYKLSYAPITGASTYITTNVIPTVTTGTSQNSTITGLTPNTQYDFRVLPVNAAGDGPAASTPVGVSTTTESLPVADWSLTFSSSGPVISTVFPNIVPHWGGGGTATLNFVNNQGRSSYVMQRIPVPPDSINSGYGFVTLDNSNVPKTYTKTVWFKPASLTSSDYQNLISGYTVGDPGSHYIFTPTAGTLTGGHIATNTWGLVSESSTLSVNNWYFIAFSFDNNLSTNNANLYHYTTDGTLTKTTGSITQFPYSTTVQGVQVGTVSGGNGLNGCLDRPAVYSSVLTDRDIFNLFQYQQNL